VEIGPNVDDDFGISHHTTCAVYDIAKVYNEEIGIE